MWKLVPQDEREKRYIETLANIIRSSGRFNFEYGNVQLRDLISFSDNTDVYGLDFQIAFRRFTFQRWPSINLPRQRYFAGTYLKEKVIALNTKLSFRERSFTLAHEIGHVLLGHKPVALDRNISKKMELQANYFAYCLLLPSDIFIQSAYGFDFHLSSLSKHYCCPIERIMKRLVMLFEGTQYISFRTGNASFSIGKYCKNPINLDTIKINGEGISKKNIAAFLDKYKIPQHPRSYLRCSIKMGGKTYMFKFHTRYDIFRNIEILGFGYDMEKKYEKVPRDPNG